VEQIVDKLTMRQKDIECLDHGEYFNDIIINFYINYLQLSLEQDSNFQSNVSLMNTYWINDLFHKQNVNLFMKMIEKNKLKLDKQVVIYPANFANEHHWAA
jgi:Ulp1 family protease